MTGSAGLIPSRYFFWKDNIADTAYAFSSFGPQVQGYGGIKTSGSSTTITSMTGIPVPAFTSNGVGDALEIRYLGAGGATPATYAMRKIVTYTDADTIVVDTAINIGTSGTPSWSYYKRMTSGTAATDGWIHVGDLARPFTVVIEAPTLGETDGIDYIIQGKQGSGMDGGIFTVVGATQITQANIGTYAVTIPATPSGTIGPSEFQFCRVGIKGHTASTGADIVSAYIVGRQIH